jgi:hypothetical protein
MLQWLYQDNATRRDSMTFLITLVNGYKYKLKLTLSQPSYYADEYAYKLARMQDSKVLSVVQIPA